MLKRGGDCAYPLFGDFLGTWMLSTLDTLFFCQSLPSRVTSSADRSNSLAFNTLRQDKTERRCREVLAIVTVRVAWALTAHLQAQHVRNELSPTAQRSLSLSSLMAARAAAKRKRASAPVSPSDSPAASRARSADEKMEVEVEWAWEGTLMKRQREAGNFLDVTLVVAGARKIEAHKCVLAGLSPVLESLFTSGLSESAQSEVTVGDASTDGRAVEAIVDCMYSGRIALSSGSVASVIRTANMLQVDAIEKAACDFFVERLEPSTAPAALGFAAEQSECGVHARELVKRCLDFMMQHFVDCSADPAFVTLPSDAVARLLGSDDLPVDEENVLSALRKWVEHDSEGRRSALKELVPLVRFPLLPTEAQLQMKAEPLLRRVMQMDDEGLTLGMNLLTECLAGFKQSDEASSCPRLKWRLAPPWPASIWLDPRKPGRKGRKFWSVNRARLSLSEEYDYESESGAGACRHVMSNGKHCAEFAVELGADNMCLGVAKSSLDLVTTMIGDDSIGEGFWGYYSPDGEIKSGDPAGDWIRWQGRQAYGSGDIIRLLLDLDVGTLTVKLNGDLLGVAVKDGLKGESLRWAAEFCAGQSIGLRILDADEF
eukprot:COSAG04_NODE_2683_length_3741_cov_2.132345_2_plen_600_part_00